MRPAAQKSVQSLSMSRDSVVMMPAVIEKEDVKIGKESSSTTVIERENDSTKEKQRGYNSGSWEVRIYNDGMNTREHVARSLVQVTGMAEISAYQTMMQAHQHGMAVVGRWPYELAEMYHDALKKNGIVCDLVPVEDE